MGKLMVAVARVLPLCAVVLVCSIMVLPDITFAQQSTVAISPTQGPPGTIVIGTGTNWRPGDRMQISWDSGEVLANITVGSNGSFSASFRVPSNATAGTHTIYFTDVDARYFLVATFTIAPVSVAPVSVEQVWTTDADFQNKTAFKSGAAIFYIGSVHNALSHSVTANFIFQATGVQEIYYWTGGATVPPGTSVFHSPSLIPDDARAGNYTAKLTVTYDGLNSTKQSSFTVTEAPPVSFLAPFNKGRTFTVLSGYYNNRVQSVSGCHIGRGPDHCRHQLFGLDLMPSEESDRAILAPVPGTVRWRDTSPDCLGLEIGDGFNLTICHFGSYNVNIKVGDHVPRGKVLGTRQPGVHVHLSLDNRRVNPWLPVPFNEASGGHTFQATSLNPNHNGRGETVTYETHTYTVEFNEWTGVGWASTNEAVP